ncbi:hypothetical protein [Henriciella aquimarina]|uniref:hypothetical protein n=1 Tax=Henriciella aquimarina TaxID=545261 RepID=UPI0009FE4443|nr:hypothetical protein [Henriciella aquimarina]
MKYEIENNSPFGKAFKVFGGTEVVKRGETKTVDCEYEFAPEQVEAFARDDVIITPAKDSKSGGKSASKDSGSTKTSGNGGQPKSDTKKDGEEE